MLKIRDQNLLIDNKKRYIDNDRQEMKAEIIYTNDDKYECFSLHIHAGFSREDLKQLLELIQQCEKELQR